MWKKINNNDANDYVKVVLENSIGLRMLYYKDCKIVELEIGAVSLRLYPDALQRMANMMMKASLQLYQ